MEGEKGKERGYIIAGGITRTYESERWGSISECERGVLNSEKEVGGGVVWVMIMCSYWRQKYE